MVAAAPVAELAAATDAPLDTPRLLRAWRMVMESGEGLAGGLSVLLRGVPVAATENGTVAIRLAPDSPARERLQSAAARRSLQDALALRLGRPIELEILTAAPDAEGAPGPTRITAEVARQERLKHLTQQEPLLARAVQEWDLELAE
jgi:hypothetical protein